MISAEELRGAIPVEFSYGTTIKIEVTQVRIVQNVAYLE
jgi:hypothetical protein